MSLLFHPKKTAKNTIRRANPTSSPNPTPSASPRKPPGSGAPSPNKPPEDQVDEDEETNGMKLPDLPFTEYKVMSSALNGWKYDVMKFDSRKSVDISRWQAPVKLNRKDLRREDPAASGVGQAVRPMLGPDGNQVYGVDGKPVMVDVEGRPVTESSSSSSGGTKGKGGPGGPNNKKKFQKKTRQVFIVPEETRLLRREERYPWVMEDAAGQETWTAQLEDLGKAETHAFFMPAANDIFKFVPSHRWYKFQKKLKHDLPTDSLTVEAAYQKNQKRDPSTWLQQRNGKGPSAATAAMFKAESEGRTVDLGSGSLVHSSGQSYAAGGRKLKAVDSGADGLFGDDEEEDSKRKAKEYGGEGDFEEMVYEEEFADDEEQMEVDNDDEEAKELEERIKKEYMNANKTREGYIDESEDEDESKPMSKQAKAMQKMLRSREGNDAYDSDEEKNPYASSAEEEEEEEPAPVTNEPAVLQQQTAKSGSQPPAEAADVKPPVPASRPPTANDSGSRATSPTPGLGGHSVVAKRATSPKAPKLKSNNVSRASSPLAGNGSRATSPIAVSPVNPTQQQQNGLQKKRKAEENPASPTSPNGTGPPKLKKRKPQPPGGAAVATPTGPLEDRLLIEWLKNTPNASTRECIQYFTPYLTDDEKKTRFTALVKEVATLRNGTLVLRNAYRGESAAPSPSVSG
ncbi:Rap30/74 interaction domain-containing protein [Dendrothele bispora CBS 962.96]|uniref:Transcription initiation factor IIF subunit alpha n=1 Tax=Dendrothele bispora (strain CBS 962.96) TaxID=1314807 RepID=A0A4S8MZ13_DENBC|nr:Rap30/74 interaction domain-containing protein [Dendrothele bispora CBS 962.96]